MKIQSILLLAILSAFPFVSCKTDRSAQDAPYFETRGIVLAWDDVKDSSGIDWIRIMKKDSLNTISVVGGQNETSEEFLDFKQRCIDNGFDFEYQEHAMSYLMPRELFADHPEYFRMDENGKRTPDGNCCPSNEEALKVMMSNVREYAEKHTPTNHRYYTWLFDGGDICHCDKCKYYNAADQGLIFENHIIKALREFDPEAQLAHLAYENTTPAPSKIKPENGIFLEFAPFYRRWDKPLSDRDAIREGEKWSHGDYLDMLADNLKVFPAETAMVLEYWLDVSQRSNWTRPAVKLDWHRDVFLDDLKTYAEYGIRHIRTYGVFIDSYYANTYKDLSFIDDYGLGLLNFRKPQ